MTTAHRPTWAPAKGGEEQGGMRFYAPSNMQSVKDIAGQTTIKYRKDGQNSLEELKRKDLRAALEDKERKHFLKASKEGFLAEKEEDLRLLEAGLAVGGGRGDGGGPILVSKAIDADVDADDDDDASDDSDSDDDDDEAELLAELARIKKEREEEAARKAAEEAAAAEQSERKEMMRGNPLLEGKLAASVDGGGGGANFALKRRWDDDVVFKNQARNEPKQQRRFVNDTLRSDFHKRFLERYIK